MKTPTIAELSLVFLHCRTYGHDWEPQVTYYVEHGRSAYHRAVLVCGKEARAGVEDPSEKELLSYATGRLKGLVMGSPVYRYAEGYLIEEQIGRGKSRPLARLELNDRVAIPAPAEEKVPA